jgi:hypothetical protein
VNDDMLAGYLDGLDPDAPEPSSNRSACYRHGFANGRDDRNGKPRASADTLRREADAAAARDAAQ